MPIIFSGDFHADPETSWELSQLLDSGWRSAASLHKERYGGDLVPTFESLAGSSFNDGFYLNVHAVPFSQSFRVTSSDVFRNHKVTKLGMTWGLLDQLVPQWSFPLKIPLGDVDVTEAKLEFLCEQDFDEFEAAFHECVERGDAPTQLCARLAWSAETKLVDAANDGDRPLAKRYCGRYKTPGLVKKLQFPQLSSMGETTSGYPSSPTQCVVGNKLSRSGGLRSSALCYDVARLIAFFNLCVRKLSKLVDSVGLFCSGSLRIVLVCRMPWTFGVRCSSRRLPLKRRVWLTKSGYR